MFTDTKFLFLALVFVTHFMCGLIWFVQIVHYPLFARVGSEQFKLYEQIHCSLTGSVVMVPMVVQLILSLWLAVSSAPGAAKLMWSNFALVVVIWVITGFCSVPCHNNLCENGFSEAQYSYLLTINWIRTVCWTICSLILSIVLFRQ